MVLLLRCVVEGARLKETCNKRPEFGNLKQDFVLYPNQMFVPTEKQDYSKEQK